jgi:exodeoxyribonuclease X
MSEKVAFILDTETDAKTDPRPLQVAYIDLASGAVFNKKYSTGRKICRATMAVHHISDEDVADCPRFNLDELPHFDYMIGHNIDYDWRVIGEPEVKRICTYALSKTHFPEFTGQSLGSCVYHLLPADEARALTKEAHDALADCQANQVLYEAICARLKIDPLDFEKVYKASEKARIPKVMPFGKHRGELIENLPLGYLDWAVKSLDQIDPFLKQALVDAKDAIKPPNALEQAFRQLDS